MDAARFLSIGSSGGADVNRANRYHLSITPRAECGAEWRYWNFIASCRRTNANIQSVIYALPFMLRSHKPFRSALSRRKNHQAKEFRGILQLPDITAKFYSRLEFVCKGALSERFKVITAVSGFTLLYIKAPSSVWIFRLIRALSGTGIKYCPHWTHKERWDLIGANRWAFDANVSNFFIGILQFMLRDEVQTSRNGVAFKKHQLRSCSWLN